MLKIPSDTTQIVRQGVERACRDFTARIAPLGFMRTRKMLWTRRLPLTADLIHLHRGGSSYGKPINYSVDLRVGLGVRVLNDLFETFTLNGPTSDLVVRRASGASYHLRFNAGTGSTYERCIDDLAAYVIEQAEPWFNRFRSAEALLANSDSPLRDSERERFRLALNGQHQPEAVAQSLAMLGIKERNSQRVASAP